MKGYWVTPNGLCLPKCGGCGVEMCYGEPKMFNRTLAPNYGVSVSKWRGCTWICERCLNLARVEANGSWWRARMVR